MMTINLIPSNKRDIKYIHFMNAVSPFKCERCGGLDTVSYRRVDGTFFRECKLCRRSRSRNNLLRLNYGVTSEMYLRLSESQNHSCAICNKSRDSFGVTKSEPLYVDHCHATGKVRGLLCAKCNSALGMLSDKIDSAKRLVSYLEKHSYV